MSAKSIQACHEERASCNALTQGIMGKGQSASVELQGLPAVSKVNTYANNEADNTSFLVESWRRMAPKALANQKLRWLSSPGALFFPKTPAKLKTSQLLYATLAPQFDTSSWCSLEVRFAQVPSEYRLVGQLGLVLLVNLGDKLDDVLTLVVIMKEQRKQAVISLGMLHLTTPLHQSTAFMPSLTRRPNALSMY